MPFSEAIQLDAAAQYDLGTICPRTRSDPQTDPLRWQWMCLAANQKHPLAQHVMGIFYKGGREPVSQDLVRAYVWYRLLEINGVEEVLSGRGRYVKTATGWKCCLDGKPRREAVMEQLTPNQIAEAERLVAEWEPNPAECEVEGEQAEN